MLLNGNRKPISGLPRDVNERTGQPGALTYRRTYNMAVDGVLPAVELVGNRWFYDPARVGEIIAVLGLEQVAA